MESFDDVSPSDFEAMDSFENCVVEGDSSTHDSEPPFLDTDHEQEEEEQQQKQEKEKPQPAKSAKGPTVKLIKNLNANGKPPAIAGPVVKKAPKKTATKKRKATDEGTGTEEKAAKKPRVIKTDTVDEATGLLKSRVTSLTRSYPNLKTPSAAEIMAHLSKGPHHVAIKAFDPKCVAAKGADPKDPKSQEQIAEDLADCLKINAVRKKEIKEWVRYAELPMSEFVHPDSKHEADKKTCWRIVYIPTGESYVKDVKMHTQHTTADALDFLKSKYTDLKNSDLFRIELLETTDNCTKKRVTNAKNDAAELKESVDNEEKRKALETTFFSAILRTSVPIWSVRSSFDRALDRAVQYMKWDDELKTKKKKHVDLEASRKKHEAEALKKALEAKAKESETRQKSLGEELQEEDEEEDDDLGLEVEGDSSENAAGADMEVDESENESAAGEDDAGDFDV